MAGILSTFAEFGHGIIREWVKAGIASAREKEKPYGRPKTASLKKDEIRKLQYQESNNSQIARQLKISRGSVIGLLKKSTEQNQRFRFRL